MTRNCGVLMPMEQTSTNGKMERGGEVNAPVLFFAFPMDGSSCIVTSTSEEAVQSQAASAERSVCLSAAHYGAVASRMTALLMAFCPSLPLPPLPHFHCPTFHAPE